MQYKAMLILCISVMLSAMSPTTFAQATKLDYEYLGVALEAKGKHIWGTSPIIGPDGKVHLYVAQWSLNGQKDFSGWFKESEIGHYVGDTPQGPFKYVGIAVADKGGKFNAPHNPTIKKIDGKYVLSFIVNEDSKLATQRIIMYVADDLKDNWRPAAGAEPDGTILRKGTHENSWNKTAKLGISNPTLLKVDGKYFLYNKAVLKKNPKKKWGAYTYGVAISDTLEGPYNYTKQVTPDWRGIEDVYAFEMNGSVYFLSRDFGSKKGSHGGGLLWQSDDGLYFPWENVTRSFEALDHYVGKETLADNTVYRGDLTGRLERPQILFEDGKPAYLYMATGINSTPGHGSRSHVFKIHIEAETKK